MALEVLPVKATRKQGNFDIYNEMKKIIRENGIAIMEEDILVISSKYISNSQGRMLNHSSIKGLLLHRLIIFWHQMLVLTNQIRRIN